MGSLRIIVAAVALAVAGCEVHDGHEGQEAPVWWPTPFYRAQPGVSTTQASLNGGGRTSGGAEAAAYSSAPRDVRVGWDLTYDQHEITPPPSSDNLTLQQPAHEPPATLYPNRGQAALGANSATLYPPNNTFVTDPGRNASVYPRGPAGPTGYIGK